VNLEAAAAYAERHALEAMLAVRGGEIAFERYAPGFDAETPHALYSGTKSFWGVAAVAAQEDGLLSLDETVGATFPAWNAGRRARVTLRHLLTLTSGIGFGGLGNAVPAYAKALDVDLTDEPGATFTYGGIPLQVFGAVFAAKLAARMQTPHAYLRERILAPAGCTVASWRALKDGTHPLPTGAFLTARAWAAYGAFAAREGRAAGGRIVSEASFAACLEPTEANPRYGLGWWLSPLPARPRIFYASGSGGQALYVFPDDDLAIVKFSKNASGYAHPAFLRRLFEEDASPSASKGRRNRVHV
jgi:CubicO group peptidase (beta-lactamase class C family)